MFETALQVLLQGLLLGGLYCLFALGQSLMFGVMRLTNTAQGDFIVLGAFAAIAGLSALGALGLPDALLPWLAGLLLLPLAFGFGYALQRWVLNGTLGKDPLPSLVVTFGLAIVIQNLLLELFSADPRSIETAGLNTRSLALPGGFAVGVLPLLILGVGGGRHRGAAVVVQPHAARPRLSRRVRRQGDRRADGAELEPGLRAGHGHRLRADRAGRRAAGHAHDGVAVRRAAAAAVRLRGGDHRRHGLVLGHARWARCCSA